MASATLVSVLVTVGIVLSLIPTTFRLVREITTQIFGTVWAPLFTPSQWHGAAVNWNFHYSFNCHGDCNSNWPCFSNILK